jgi:hypothetical protein
MPRGRFETPQLWQMADSAAAAGRDGQSADSFAQTHRLRGFGCRTWMHVCVEQGKITDKLEPPKLPNC